MDGQLAVGDADVLQLVDGLQQLNGPLAVLHRRGGLLVDDAIVQRLAADVLHEGVDVAVQLEDLVDLGEVGRFEGARIVGTAVVAEDAQGGGEQIGLVAAGALLQVGLLRQNRLLLFGGGGGVELVHAADDDLVLDLEAGRLDLRHGTDLLSALRLGEILHVARLVGHVHGAGGGDVLVLC